MIGLFDSGVGGLCILRAVQRHIPEADLVYVADSAWFPYGSKQPAEIQARTETITRFLIDQGARLVVVACNSASGAAIVRLRERFDIPFVGVEPAVKVAVDKGGMSRIGVLCTEATADAVRYQHLLDRVTKGMEVITISSSGLASLVERGEDLQPSASAVVAAELHPLMKAGVDAVVLGCTHYAFLKGLMEELSGLPVLEPSGAVARQVARRYPSSAGTSARGRLLVYTTGLLRDLRAFVEGHGMEGLQLRKLDLGPTT